MLAKISLMAIRRYGTWTHMLIIDGMETSTETVGRSKFTLETLGAGIGRRDRFGVKYPAPDCKIWEAVRATFAAPTFFKHIVIDGKRYVCEDVNIHYEGLHALWRLVECILEPARELPRQR